MARREAVEFLDVQVNGRGQIVGPLTVAPHFFNQIMLIDQVTGLYYQLTVENGVLVVQQVTIN